MVVWEKVGIYEFIQLTTHEVKPWNALLEGALNYWSSTCNSMILPFGPMSITLRDVVALMGLPIFGEEVPSRVEAIDFAHLKVMTGTYPQMIAEILSHDPLTDDDHVGVSFRHENIIGNNAIS